MTTTKPRPTFAPLPGTDPMREVPRLDWPDGYFSPKWRHGLPVAVFRSSRYFVGLWSATDGILRLTVNRVDDDPKTGRWRDGITWDELQRIKTECGFGDRDAVEVYPRDSDVINEAPMRHLWIMPEPLAWCWRAATYFEGDER